MAVCAVYALKKLLRTLRSPSRYSTVDRKFPSGTSLGELNSANINGLTRNVGGEVMEIPFGV